MAVAKTARTTAEQVRDLWPAHEPGRALPKKIRAAIDAHLRATFKK